MRTLSPIDQFLGAADNFLRSIATTPPSSRPYPAKNIPEGNLSDTERKLAAALMRVNHSGEVAAQALYQGQAFTAKSPEMSKLLHEAAVEEADHLNWTAKRIEALGSRTSVLAPFWYVGAFTIGAIAGRMGDRVSLGFLAETERQVEQHLMEHMSRLPLADEASRAVVEQMKEDEAKHMNTALDHGGADLPGPVQMAMRASSKVMTTVAHYI
ncbi:MAG: 2-polyprenyl-3-methyl-6-methoxy-1,4-benzoquinone monooxygenase [Burkholderiaceae bacterium]|nr:2-polyprenyl-3-methyl-6-methoxy-1,4-benzoquinone monooxygenase [Burkholderiaceae bacterium]